MKKTKFVLGCSLVALTAIPVLTGCKKKGKDVEPDVFSFSIDLESGRNELENAPGVKDKILIYTNGVGDDSSRSYTFTSSSPSIAEIDDHGIITPKGEGQVSFTVKEVNSGKVAQLVNPIRIVPEAKLASGGRNYSAQTKRADGTSFRTEILGKLEKYAMDTHLTGITLFDNGGYVKYSKRVTLPADDYISGYGFGLLREGDALRGDLAKDTPKMDYYHTSISQDPQNINAMNASGSLISDLSSYITSAYFSTKLAANKKNYEWYPVLAKDKVSKPKVDSTGNISSWTAEEEQIRPIPMEKPNDLKMYKKWRIYLKTGASDGLAYTHLGNHTSFNNRPVALEDYEFAYQLLLTGNHGLSRGAEMAGDTSYGIKGALSFYNATLNETDQNKIDQTWNNMKEGNALGIHTGTDKNNNEYIELELVNPIDEFTAMYTLSSSLVSPIPRAFIETLGGGSVKKGSDAYGAYKNGIVNNVICCGPYSLEEWVGDQAIVFKRNDNWYEHKNLGFYKIPGIYNRIIDSSNDIEAVYSQFNQGLLDVCGIPSTKIETESKLDGVKKTKGDSTFKLNVNSCTQSQWDELFGANGSINKGSHWDVKPWMSNRNFLNGLFYSINRNEFATKRGVQPSINYFSDAYLDDAEAGHSYNKTDEHEAAVSSYHTVVKNALGEETYNDYGYNYDKAVNSFKTAVNQLTSSYQLVKGTKEKPTDISIEICWMYPTDDTEYGEDIASYIEKAFNDNKVSNGTVRLTVKNTHVDNWEDVYNERMMKGQFDLGFGAISGNTLNPLNFLEVLKSDNSSSFTLNWGNDTSKVDPIHPIYLTNPETGENEKWSFDALWEVADHGGIIQNGVKEKAIKNCYKTVAYNLSDKRTDTLKDGFKMDLPIDFIEVDGAEFDLSRVTIFADGAGYYEVPNATLVKKPGQPDVVQVTVSQELAAQIDQDIYNNLYRDDGTDKTDPNNAWKLHPFLASKYHDDKGGNWHFELWYQMKLGGGQPTENSVYVKTSENAKD